MKKKFSQADKNEALNTLRSTFPFKLNYNKQYIVYYIVRRRSDLSRCVSFCVIDKNGELVSITDALARYFDLHTINIDGKYAVRLWGCGSNTALTLIMNLQKTLYPSYNPDKSGRHRDFLRGEEL